MPHIYRKKVYKSGNSYVVTLPPQWIKYIKEELGIEPKELELIMISNTEINIKVPQPKKLLKVMKNE